MAKFLSFKFLSDLIQNACVMKFTVVKFSRFLTFAKIKSQQTFPVIR